MEKNQILELLKKLNSLDISDLDEEIAKMEMSYEQWSKLMGEKGYWAKSFSDIVLEEDNEALLGKRDIGFEDFKRLSKEYGRKWIEPKKPRDTIEGQIEEESQLLQDKLDPVKRIEEYNRDIKYFKICIEEDELDQEAIDEYKQKITESQSRIKRCEEFQSEREGKSTPEQDVKTENSERDSKATNNSKYDNVNLEDFPKVLKLRSKLEVAIREHRIGAFDREFFLDDDMKVEYDRAEARIQLKDDLDKNHVTNGVGPKGYFKDEEQYRAFLDKCRELSLDPRAEIRHMEQRKSLRDDMEVFTRGNSNIDKESLKRRCEALSLSFDEEQNRGKRANLNIGDLVSLRRDFEIEYRNPSDLEGTDAYGKCTKAGMDYNDERILAEKRVQFKDNLDKNHVTNGVGAKGYFKDEEQYRAFLDKCRELNLDPRAEILHMEQRKSLREDMQLFVNGDSDIDKESLKRKCKTLGLSFDKEEETALKTKKADEQEGTLPIASDPKVAVKNIGTGLLARDVRADSSEMRINYKEFENPVKSNEEMSL